jgi:hypothetical protein
MHVKGAIMNRRAFSALIPGALLLVLSGCDEEPTPSSTATLTNNEEVHQAMKSVVTALESLESNVDDFDTTNWREVVPEVKNDAEELRAAVDSLRSALGYPE